MSEDLDLRLAAVEARQRAYKMHDPGCPALVLPERMASLFGGMLRGDCDCWLADPATLCPACHHPLKGHVDGHCLRGAEPLGKVDEQYCYRLACLCAETPPGVTA